MIKVFIIATTYFLINYCHAADINIENFSPAKLKHEYDNCMLELIKPNAENIKIAQQNLEVLAITGQEDAFRYLIRTMPNIASIEHNAEFIKNYLANHLNTAAKALAKDFITERLNIPGFAAALKRSIESDREPKFIAMNFKIVMGNDIQSILELRN